MMKALSLKQNLLWNSIGCLTYQGCQWLTTIFVVTLSSNYENSGALAFAMSVGNVFSAVATYNIRTFQVSDSKNEYTSQNYIGFRFATISVALIIFCFYAFIISPSLNTLLTILIYLVFKSDEAFSNVLYGIDQKAYRMDYIGISQGIRGILSIGAFSAGLYFFDSLPFAIGFMFAACFCVTVLFDIPKSSKLDRVSPKITKRICFELFRRCAPIVVSLVIYGLVASIVRQYFGISNGEDALGIYAAVATPCVLVQVLANYLYSPFLVPLAESWNSGNIRQGISELKKLSRLMALVILVCILASWAIGPQALELIYGNSITTHSWMITPAIIAASLMAVSCFMSDFLVIMRRFNASLAINVIALVCCLLTMVPFISVWCMNGVNLVLIASFGIATACGAIIIGFECHKALQGSKLE